MGEKLRRSVLDFSDSGRDSEPLTAKVPAHEQRLRTDTPSQWQLRGVTDVSRVWLIRVVGLGALLAPIGIGLAYTSLAGSSFALQPWLLGVYILWALCVGAAYYVVRTWIVTPQSSRFVRQGDIVRPEALRSPADVESFAAPDLQTAARPAAMRLKVSMPVQESDWLRDYAARRRRHPADVISAAIARARQSIVRPGYIEPGTSTTQRGIVEIEVSLSSEDAQWLLLRATEARATPCAVLGATLRGYKEVAPPIGDDVGFATTIRGQTLFYQRLNSICDDVASGKDSPETADQRLAEATAVRLYDLLPEVDRGEVLRAVTVAMRELCLNHPALRAAHGRDK